MTTAVIACKSGWIKIFKDGLPLDIGIDLLRKYNSDEAVQALLERCKDPVHGTLDIWSIEEELGPRGVLGYLREHSPNYIYYWDGERWFVLDNEVDDSAEADWCYLDSLDEVKIVMNCLKKEEEETDVELQEEDDNTWRVEHGGNIVKESPPSCIIIACKSGWGKIDDVRSALNKVRISDSGCLVKIGMNLVYKYRSDEDILALLEENSSIRSPLDIWTIEEKFGPRGVLGHFYEHIPDYICYWNGSEWLILGNKKDGNSEIVWRYLEYFDELDLLVQGLTSLKKLKATVNPKEENDANLCSCSL